MKGIGGWAFLIGILLAVIFAFYQFPNLIWLLLVFGLIIGLLNITEKETDKFLMSAMILVLVGYLAGNTLESVLYVPELFDNIVALFAPATIVVALKSVFSMAKD